MRLDREVILKRKTEVNKTTCKALVAIRRMEVEDSITTAAALDTRKPTAATIAANARRRLGPSSHAVRYNIETSI